MRRDDQPAGFIDQPVCCENVSGRANFSAALGQPVHRHVEAQQKRKTRRVVKLATLGFVGMDAQKLKETKRPAGAPAKKDPNAPKRALNPKIVALNDERK
jgi:hypothetical protein